MMTRIDELRKEYYYNTAKGKHEDVTVNGYAKFLEQKLINAEKQVKNIAYEPVLANCNTTLDRCECEEPKEEPIKICLNCNGYIE